MAKRILIMGLPGAGKTTLAEALQKKLGDCAWFNADNVREQFNDWDFSHEGRIRQSKRMHELADNCPSNPKYVIADFVAPTKELRDIFDAHYVIWVDTIKESRFIDTNKVFEIPKKYDYRVTEQDATKYAELILVDILDKW